MHERKVQAALATVSTAKSVTFLLVKSFLTWQATRSTTEYRANVKVNTIATVAANTHIIADSKVAANFIK